MMGLPTLPLNSLTVAYTSIPLPLVFLPIYLTWFHGIVLLFIIWNGVIDGGKPKIRHHNLPCLIFDYPTMEISLRWRLRIWCTIKNQKEWGAFVWLVEMLVVFLFNFLQCCSALESQSSFSFTSIPLPLVFLSIYLAWFH